MEAISLLIASLIVPWAVQLIKTNTVSGNVARWMAIGLSVIAGIVVGFIAGIPADAAGLVACVFACVGGVQVAYAAFKAVGITCGWLDALLNIGTPSRQKFDDEKWQ